MPRSLSAWNAVLTDIKAPSTRFPGMWELRGGTALENLMGRQARDRRGEHDRMCYVRIGVSLANFDIQESSHHS